MSERLGPPGTPESEQAITNVVVLNNPKSKNRQEAKDRIAQLRQLFPHKGQVTLLNTEPELEVTRRLILDELTEQIGAGKQPVLAIAGGDGTVNMVLQTIVSDMVPDYIREVPIVPLGTGNANDLAFMLYDDPTDLETIFRLGLPKDIHPLVCSIQPPAVSGKKTYFNTRLAERRVAGNYISFGASAEGAHELNKEHVRRYAHSTSVPQRHMPDYFAVRAAMQADPFHIQQNDEIHHIREILFSNGERAAKLGKTSARLDKPEMYTAMVPERMFVGRMALLLGMFQMATGNLPGKMLQDTSYTFTVRETVPVQYDGEAAYVRGGSTITISHSALAFRTLATKL